MSATFCSQLMVEEPNKAIAAVDLILVSMNERRVMDLFSMIHYCLNSSRVDCHTGYARGRYSPSDLLLLDEVL